MILEGVVTTINEDDTANISPMGSQFDRERQFIELRPFQSSRTYKNIKRTGCGVLHVVDDVMLLAQSAINRWEIPPTLEDTAEIQGKRIATACQAFEFETTFLDDTAGRTSIQCKVVRAHNGPRFFGFNRAKHSVLEAAILATRIDFLPIEEINTKFSELKTIIEKTGGDQEHAAFRLLVTYLEESQTQSGS